MTQSLLGVCLLAFIFLRRADPTEAQPLPETQGYTCDANQTASYPCQTYAFYRAASPSFLDLASIGDLFEVSRLMIAEPSNITYPNATLFPNQLLFVPITCSCNRLQTNDSTNITSISYANISYTIKSGDTFFDVSTAKFENLTTYQSVEAVNPTLVATNLSIGAEAIFPIFCKCPDANTTGTRPNYLVSYVFQPSDNVSTVASLFNVSSQSITDLNGNDPQPFETIFVPVSRLPNLTQPTTFPSAPSTKTDRKGVIIGLSIGIGILGIVLILIILLWMCCARKTDYYEEDEEKINKDKTISRKGEAEVSLMADVSGCLDKYRVFKMDELREATEGFSPRCLIQGSVYRGVIDGEVFAIKKMNWNASEELKILQKVNHGNLVKLEGFCIDPEDGNCYLIYEFVENGSLHSWIHENKVEKLNWKTRLRIAIDVANGLQYIHEHTRPRVVHKDIKSTNILLDSSMRAKIANFGLAKSGCNAITMHIVGTQGYIAPEYLSDGVVSTRMDVFSFGVVLLELISGKEVVDEEGRVMWATTVEMFDGALSEDLKQRKLRGWMDDSLMADTISIESVASVLNIAISCLNKDPAKRPGIVEIVYTLSKSDDVFFDTSEDGPSIQPLLAR